MHCFNLGFGKDLAASGIFLMARFGAFGAGSIRTKLEAAFGDFELWCREARRTTSLKYFDLKTFKIQSILGGSIRIFL